MCSTSSPRLPRCIKKPAGGSTTPRSTAGSAKISIVREPSLRHYVRAKELKAAGMDWTEVLAEEVENRRARLATEILASPAYDSTSARVNAFIQQGGGCRATFFQLPPQARQRDGARIPCLTREQRVAGA